MFIVYPTKGLPALFLTKERADIYVEEHTGTRFQLTTVEPARDYLALVVAWLVHPNGRFGQALFLDREKALQYSVDRHTTYQPLFLIK